MMSFTVRSAGWLLRDESIFNFKHFNVLNLLHVVSEGLRKNYLKPHDNVTNGILFGSFSKCKYIPFSALRSIFSFLTDEGVNPNAILLRLFQCNAAKFCFLFFFVCFCLHSI